MVEAEAITEGSPLTMYACIAGALINDRAKAKFKQPRASDAVVDREYLLTFRHDTSPETVSELARCR